jgi:polygalacturonase
MVFDVKRYGAVGDGLRVETRQLQAAIDACAAAGGGTVRLAEGSFVTGTLYLKSNGHPPPHVFGRVAYGPVPVVRPRG